MDAWEILEYIGETLVFIGVVGEVFAEWREPERKKLGKASSIVLVIGLALSLASLIGTNEYFNGTIAELNLQAAKANECAAALEKQAKIDAGTVASLAKQASDAESDFAKASQRAANAETELEQLRLSIPPRRSSQEQRDHCSGYGWNRRQVSIWLQLKIAKPRTSPPTLYFP